MNRSKSKSLLMTMSLVVAIAGIVSACAGMKSRSNLKTAEGAASDKPSLMKDRPGEVSLRSDRSHLDDFRKDIPEEVKKSNDEIAAIMSFIVRDSEEEPNRLRERFSTALRKKREATDKKLRHAREDFTKHERADREAFMKKSKDERDRYVSGGKRTTDERKRFFDDQEDRRKVFFADQSEKRKDFEQHVSEERKAVEDYNREKQNAFNQECRSYQTRYTERKKQADLKKRMEEKSRELERAGKSVQPITPGSTSQAENLPAENSADEATSATSPVVKPQDPLAEFDKIPKGAGVPLAPGKKGP